MKITSADWDRNLCVTWHTLVIMILRNVLGFVSVRLTAVVLGIDVG